VCNGRIRPSGTHRAVDVERGDHLCVTAGFWALSSVDSCPWDKRASEYELSGVFGAEGPWDCLCGEVSLPQCQPIFAGECMPSDAHGAKGALGPACAGAQVSPVLQGMGWWVAEQG
jgi:hypothetical protein